MRIHTESPYQVRRRAFMVQYGALGKQFDSVVAPTPSG
jgi:hypothetical protein